VWPDDLPCGALSETYRVDQSETVISAGTDEKGGVPTVAPVRPPWERVLPWAMALVFASIYATVSLARFHRMEVWSFDLGIYEQAVRHYASFQAPIVDLEGAGHNFLGDHWNPAFAVFAPFYRLFPGPVTLLVGQAVVIALAVVPITRAGMRHLGRWSGIAVGLAFGMSFGIQAAVDFDFHEVCLAVPLLAFALEAFLARRWPVVVAWAAPLVLVKEDLGLTVAALGLVLVLVGARRWGVGLGVFGLASAALTITVLIPYFNADHGQSKTFLEASKSAAGESLVRRIYDLPFEVVTSEPRALTLLLLLGVTAFLATQSPLLILVVPTLGWRFLSTNQNFWGQLYHYDLVLMPIVFAALIDGVMRARRDSWQPLRWYARAAPAIALVVGLYLCTRYSFRGLVDPATYRASPRAAAAERILAKIPDGATIETDLGLINKLTHRTRVFFVGNAAPVVPEFVLIANTAQNPAMADPVRFAATLHPGKTYVLVHAEGGFTLVRRIS
jgi:uncharacterized membrane protein